jgi:hypothetical protein
VVIVENSQRWIVILVLSFVGLGVGCGIWLGFFHDWHEIDRTVLIEQRHAEAVGAKPLPKEPVKFALRAMRHNGCVTIDRIEFDGEAMWAYYHADCPGSFVRWMARQKSPDGTIIDNWYMWIVANSHLYRGDRGEIKSDVLWHLDPRTETVEVWAETDP